MITEREEIGQLTVLSDGQAQVRTDTVIERDGVEIGRTYHRHVVAPGDDLQREHEWVRGPLEKVHTDAVVRAYRASLP